ncbi:MAG TPA: PKD domain-containing protein, partial [Jiangellaceae bacterium]|nr:PKD domain-containing protein [Jiangellaceae bacterium]
YDRRNPSTTKLPPYYDGAVFLGEFTQDTLREIRLDSKNRVFKINSLLDCGQAPSSNFPFECDNPMDMQFGPDGAFYLLTYGDGFFSANRDAGIYRWEYVKGQRAPRAVLGATPTDGQAPLTVQFSSEGSRDPDPGDSITFAWDFDNNGTVDSLDPNPLHTYTANGVYTAKLTVTDSTGKTDVKTTVITVGNSAPKVTVTTPVDGDFFAWGDTIPFTVTVTDAEDAAIDCNRVEVTFVLVHDTHGHAEENVNGCSGVLHTVAEDASHGGYIAGGISASYTDTGASGQPALTTTAQNVVQLRRQEVEFVQEHQGTDVAGGFIPLADGDFRTNLDPGDWMALNNRYRVANASTFTARVNACGSTAGTPAGVLEARLGSPDGELLATVPVTVNDTFQFCEFVPTFTNVSVPISGPAGSHRVYLVARAASGGPTTNMFKVTYVEFGS